MVSGLQEREAGRRSSDLFRLADGSEPPRERGLPHRQEASLEPEEAESRQCARSGTIYSPNLPQRVDALAWGSRRCSPLASARRRSPFAPLSGPAARNRPPVSLG